jgi:hypothetical protein
VIFFCSDFYSSVIALLGPARTDIAICVCVCVCVCVCLCVCIYTDIARATDGSKSQISVECQVRAKYVSSKCQASVRYVSGTCQVRVRNVSSVK